SSSSVGTYAGQVVMQGFLGRRIPLFLRRGLTMLPALVVLGAGLPATASLVISQVVLSFGIPFALVPLVLLTRRTDVMGSLVNHRRTSARAASVTALGVTLNGYLRSFPATGQGWSQARAPSAAACTGGNRWSGPSRIPPGRMKRAATGNAEGSDRGADDAP